MGAVGEGEVGRWRRATDSGGRVYYHHLDTRETSWTQPDGKEVEPKAGTELREVRLRCSDTDKF